MTNRKSMIELLDSVNTSYMTEAEKCNFIAQAERAEFITSSVASGIEFVKTVLVKIKSSLNPRNFKHA
ncbi:hypothetical protein [Marinomonas colpomeniae]|uniref:Uncharacterized protein n=1 Tax=Marinomonas colpomeniae TaxID=2774408 RepID=A0ABR8P0J4_9GAMM|nr:hypothetical protein [Marinomonas colpomeniae]MBD5771400.1 hypothetical protein [Marinomonas colpomeniae]